MIIKKLKLLFLVSVVLLLSSVVPTYAFTDAALRNASDGGKKEELELNPFNAQLATDFSKTGVTLRTNPIEAINSVITVLLSFMGIGTIALMLYAGFRWMTAGGNDDAVTQAKKTLRNAVIGLVLIMTAYSLTIFVARTVQRETGSFGVGGGRFSGSASLAPTRDTETGELGIGGEASGSFGDASGSSSFFAE
jgi:hypothetical protein